MDFDVITIDPVMLNWWLLCIPFYVLVLAVIMFFVAFLFKSEKITNRVAGTSFIVGILALAVGVLSVTAGATDQVEKMVTNHQQIALEQQLGYDNIDIDRSSGVFVASDADGQYVSGKLVESDTDTYIVVLDE